MPTPLNKNNALTASKNSLKSKVKPTNEPLKRKTSKSTWKGFERVVAGDFGTRRTPLSGGNGGITRADTLHPDLFIEAKYRQSFSLAKLYYDTKVLAKKENKTTVVAIKQASKEGYLILIDPKDLEEIAKLYKGKNENTNPSEGRRRRKKIVGLDNQ